MKPCIAILFGGRSSEYSVSLESATAVLTELQKPPYDIYPIGITKDGRWFHYDGPLSSIQEDSWYRKKEYLTPVVVSQDPNVHSIMELHETTITPKMIDLAFPILHGRNGEDGTVQGLFELAGIPVIGCGTLASALCMDKGRAHSLVAAAGIRVPSSVLFHRFEQKTGIQRVLQELSFPVFVNPLRAGSSYGITKVSDPATLADAIDYAFSFDEEVIVEESIEGFEVGCAVLGRRELITGRVDAILLKDGFFDFHEKYTLETSTIQMPAPLSPLQEKQVQECAKKVFRTLHCDGMARVDFFFTPDHEIVFNEVNTIPGFTSHSRYPNMMKGAGLSFGDMLQKLIGLYHANNL